MKNKIKIISVFMVLCLIFLNNILFASTTTYERNEEDNYGLTNGIIINSNNRTAALKTPLVDADEKVYDFADLLTDSEEELLYNSIQDYIEEYNMDMVIVTIDDNNKYSDVEYADDFYDYNNFGVGSNRDGLLFLIDMDNRRMYISTTGEAIRMYNDTRIDYILDDTYNYITKQDYYRCANAFISAATRYAKMGIPSGNKNTYIDSEGNYIVKGNNVFVSGLAPATVISIIATILFVAIASGKHRVIRKATQARAYLVKDSFNLSQKVDNFVNTHTSKVYDPPSSSNSGGGSGGSSTHSSSSGSSHGGGGRSF